jgi:hypothetical protein
MTESVRRVNFNSKKLEMNLTSAFHPLRTLIADLSSARVTIEFLLMAGAVAGLFIGLAVARPAQGCAALLAVPLAMFAYVWWWQSQNPDKLRSISGLDFLFGPLWPSLGAVGGFFVGMLIRSLLQKSR